MIIFLAVDRCTLVEVRRKHETKILVVIDNPDRYFVFRRVRMILHKIVKHFHESGRQKLDVCVLQFRQVHSERCSPVHDTVDGNKPIVTLDDSKND